MIFDLNFTWLPGRILELVTSVGQCWSHQCSQGTEISAEKGMQHGEGGKTLVHLGEWFVFIAQLPTPNHRWRNRISNQGVCRVSEAMVCHDLADSVVDSKIFQRDCSSRYRDWT